MEKLSKGEREVMTIKRNEEGMGRGNGSDFWRRRRDDEEGMEGGVGGGEKNVPLST